MKVAIIGHRKIDETQDLVDSLTKVITELIENENADTFLFGSRSKFNNLCYDVVTELKYTYQYIQRIYIRAEFETIREDYKDYLLTYYEDTFYPKQITGAGVFSYIERNKVLVNMCDVLIVYCDENYKPSAKTKSGTKTAVEYAQKKHKRIINLKT